MRRPLHGPVAVMIEGGQAFHAHLLNINTTGIGIAAPFNVAPGTAATICFGIPKCPGGAIAAWIQAHTSVVHCVFSSHDDCFDLGLNFVKLPGADLEAISCFLK